METIKVIKERRAVRGFDPENQLSMEDVKTIVECGMYAPMAVNKVSWHLTVVRNKEFLEELSRDVIAQMSINPTDHIKMRLAMPNYSPFYHAPTVIFVTGDKNNTCTGVNAGAAIENMLLAAKDLGIDSCWIGLANDFLKSEKGQIYMDKLNAPQDYEIIAAVALGYGNVNVPMPNKHFDKIDEIVKYID